jgi:hypothetical protein
VHRTKGKLPGWASLLQFDAAHAEQAAIELCVSQKFVRKIKGLNFATLNERADKRWQHGCHRAHPAENFTRLGRACVAAARISSAEPSSCRRGAASVGRMNEGAG